MLTIIYRAYPLISKKTIIPFLSKDEMIGFCLDSLKTALLGIEYEFILISDHCSERQLEIIESLFNTKINIYKRIDLQDSGNLTSFNAQINEIKNSRYDKLLLLEDDYFVDSDDIMLNLKALDDKCIDYSTFYYPADAASNCGGMVKKKLCLDTDEIISGTSLPSTTLTFFAKKDIALKDINYFSQFTKGGHDCSLWLKLTGSFLWFLPKILKPLFYKNIRLYLSVIKRYISFMIFLPTRKRTLIFSGTGKSTHLDSEGVYNKFNNVYFLQQKLIKFRDGYCKSDTHST